MFLPEEFKFAWIWPRFTFLPRVLEWAYVYLCAFLNKNQWLWISILRSGLRLPLQQFSVSYSIVGMNKKPLWGGVAVSNNHYKHQLILISDDTYPALRFVYIRTYFQSYLPDTEWSNHFWCNAVFQEGCAMCNWNGRDREDECTGKWKIKLNDSIVYKTRANVL